MSTTVAPGLRRIEHVMGMPIIVDVRDDDLGEGVLWEAVEDVFEWLRWVDETFSPYKSTSEISSVDCGQLHVRDSHPDVQAVLDRCDQLRVETDGYFDARAAPGHLDPSGLVKGWSVDEAAARLGSAGARNFAIYAGGDIRLRGGALPADRWRVGIQHPVERDYLAALVESHDLAIATSGAYERGSHVVDPHTGQPPTGILSVTITGPDLSTADAYATAAFAMGLDGPEWTARLSGYEAMTILDDGRVLFTGRFPSPEGVRPVP
jgi:FAD:protein FMN transferase